MNFFAASEHQHDTASRDLVMPPAKASSLSTGAPNAFTLPAVGIQIRQQSPKQLRNSATRVNSNTYLPTSQADMDRSAALVGRGTCNWKDA